MHQSGRINEQYNSDRTEKSVALFKFLALNISAIEYLRLGKVFCLVYVELSEIHSTSYALPMSMTLETS